MESHAEVPVKKIILEAVITRADGTKENLGTIAKWENREFLLKRIVRRIFR